MADSPSPPLSEALQLLEAALATIGAHIAAGEDAYAVLDAYGLTADARTQLNHHLSDA